MVSMSNTRELELSPAEFLADVEVAVTDRTPDPLEAEHELASIHRRPRSGAEAVVLDEPVPCDQPLVGGEG